MEAKAPAPGAPLDDADILPWLHLFDRLDATLAACGDPQALRTFRALGPRRQADACRRLLRERQRLVAELSFMGVCPAIAAGRPSSDPLRVATMAIDFEILAAAFSACAPMAERMDNSVLTKWLLDRARMHRQHALFLLT